MVIITSQPVDQVVNIGNTLTLSVIAVGNVPLTYRWTRDGMYVGTNSPVYIKENFSEVDSGCYKVIISEEGGGSVVSNSAIVESYEDYADYVDYGYMDEMHRDYPTFQRGFGSVGIQDNCGSGRYVSRTVFPSSVILNVNEDYILGRRADFGNRSVFSDLYPRGTRAQVFGRVTILKAESVETWLDKFADF